MKLRIWAALAAAAMMAPAGMAHAMDCCKDGQCACCRKDEATPPATPDGGHPH